MSEAIAFGGVPTGNRNAYEHMNVAGSIKYIGCCSMAMHCWNNVKKIFIACFSFTISYFRLWYIFLCEIIFGGTFN